DINNKCPLGSAAGYGVSIEIDRHKTARLLGFSGPHTNVLYASSARGKCESAILSAVSQVMLTLSRLSEDLILYSIPEFNYFAIPSEYCSGSSIMPQKNNPDVLELIRAKTAKVMGYATTAAAIVKNLPGGYNRDLQETKEVFVAGMDTTRSSVRILVPLIGKVKVNRKALLAGFAPQVFAADRALELVSGGMSFRDAYNHVKARLEELHGVDPIKAIADRTALRAPAVVDFNALALRAREMTVFAEREQRKYHGAISRLLGVKYPELLMP
ncbi:MAG: argininosuccinate lyase, partial [Lentisphaerae bacterium]|nr:argininosuccinate lyase [Lentisphaerota bacterium]